MLRFWMALIIAAISGTAFAGERVLYKVGGADYEGYRAKADGTSKGLVVIIHDWDGLTNYEMKRADMLAKMGYEAFAVDLFGVGNRLSDMPARKTETQKLYDDREKMRALILGGLAEARKGEGPAVVIGYCFGGAAVLELARSGKAENIKGYVTFHGGVTTPPGQNYPADTAPILIAHGGVDTAPSMQDVAKFAQELETAKITYTIEVYSGAPHAFSVFGGDRYQKRADEKSWASFSEFLHETLR